MIKLTNNMLDVMLVLFSNRPFNLNDIARKTKLSVMGVSKIIKKLEKEKIAAITEIGNSHVVKLNLINDNLEIFSLAEKYNYENFIKKHAKLKGFLSTLKSNLDADFVLVFGSYASGEESTGSDLDLLVVSNKDNIQTINNAKTLLNIELAPIFIKKTDFINELRKKHRLYLEIINGKRVLITGEYRFWEMVVSCF